VTELGDNQVRVSWAALTDVSAYVVRYGIVDSSERTSIRVDDDDITNVTLANLEAGVEYEIRVQAFADLPGPVSAPVMAMLDGKLLRKTV
jgi:hypothetical protein